MKIILKILFLALSNVDFEFIEFGKLTWRSYTITKILPITNKVEFIDKKEFSNTALDENSETLVLHIVVLKILAEILIHTWHLA